MHFKIHHWNICNMQKAKFSTISANKKKIYSDTILLPQTKFLLRLNNKQVLERDLNINNVSYILYRSITYLRLWFILFVEHGISVIV